MRQVRVYIPRTRRVYHGVQRRETIVVTRYIAVWLHQAVEDDGLDANLEFGIDDIGHRELTGGVFAFIAGSEGDSLGGEVGRGRGIDEEQGPVNAGGAVFGMLVRPLASSVGERGMLP